MTTIECGVESCPQWGHVLYYPTHFARGLFPTWWVGDICWWISIIMHETPILAAHGIKECGPNSADTSSFTWIFGYKPVLLNPINNWETKKIFTSSLRIMLRSNNYKRSKWSHRPSHILMFIIKRRIGDTYILSNLIVAISTNLMSNLTYNHTITTQGSFTLGVLVIVVYFL